jgi:ATP-dependent DNA ligase
VSGILTGIERLAPSVRRSGAAARTPPRPFDNPEWLFELKYAAFAGFAYIAHGAGELVSRNGNRMRRFATLAQEIVASLAGHTAILDGEIA